MTTAAGNSHEHTNRLAHESSPYLLQHAHNPVDWYPWGPEAFAAAKAQNRPIFLSVGYSTCYWCHVMERESFENADVAAEMNARFINIKVDREERPDVDQLYMTAVQALTGHGGWPMSVFMTPDRKPFHGGTYYPPRDMPGRPAFVTLLKAVDDAWQNRPQDVEKSASQIAELLGRIARPLAPARELTLDSAWIDRQIDRAVGDFDSAHGGFGSAPKFPRQTLLELLLAFTDQNPLAIIEAPEQQRKAEILEMVRRSLDAMADGGIHDHLGGGFHRYSTDAQWLAPHFEIMLYDNAMLAWLYVEAYRQTEDASYARIARGILDFALREMASPEGAFYTAFDAEVAAREGASYLWTAAEVESALRAAPNAFSNEDIALFGRVYGLDRGPNFSDPHHNGGQPEKNILYLPQPLEAVATRINTTAEELDRRLAPMRQALLAVRRQRPQPMLDRKILTSWNGLMIRALAHGGDTLGEKRYLDAAALASDYLLRHHRSRDGGLIRTSGGGGSESAPPRPLASTEEILVSTPTDPDVAGRAVEPPETTVGAAASTVESSIAEAARAAPIAGFLDDYTLLMQGLIALSEAGGNERWKDHAAALMMLVIDRFTDAQAGGFYFTDRRADELFVRQKIASDSPLPSGNAAAVMALLSLDHVEHATETLTAFAGQMETDGPAMSAMIRAVIALLQRSDPPVIGPNPRAAAPAEAGSNVLMLSAAWSSPRDLRVLVDIRPPFHISAKGSESSETLTPTVLRASVGADVEYPPGESRQFAFATGPLRIYQGQVEFLVHLHETPAKGASIRLTLGYQACSEEACLAQSTSQIEVITP